MSVRSSFHEDREFRFTSEDFERIRLWIYRYAGISLRENKSHMVYSRLTRRLRATGLTTFKDYLDLIAEQKGAEWENFVNALTTNLTAFFREPHHFSMLAAHAKALSAGASARSRLPLNIWCAGVSTGEEAYSVAMTMAEVFGTLSPPVRILATDLDTNVLAKAAAAVYPMERIEALSTERVKRFFLRGTGANENRVRIRPELCAIVRFECHNLLAERWTISEHFDAIFCRNVMIYFDKPTQYKVLSRFVPVLRDDGLLFAGHSESFYHASDLFQSRGKTVYGLTEEAKRSAAGGTARRMA